MRWWRPRATASCSRLLPGFPGGRRGASRHGGEMILPRVVVVSVEPRGLVGLVRT